MRVGYIPSQGFIVNPTAAQMSASQLDLMMAGTADAVLMIEGFCEWLSEEQMIEVRHEAAHTCRAAHKLARLYQLDKAGCL